MASEEIKKKWGTIFMGNHETSVEQLNAMREPLLKEQRQKEQAADYMERVRARAADRAREILGAAYAERQKVLEEARQEAAEQKKTILADCAKIQAEAETARRLAQNELLQAQDERKKAEEMRNAGHAEGYQAGMDQAAAELHEFRAELGQSLGSLMRAIQWQHKEILQSWRDDLVTLVQCAAQAGAGYVLKEEHEKILKNMVFQALNLLESRRAISLRVNPADEAQVSDLFRAARERYPELGQWIVTGDEKIEKGGLVAESGTGSVDLKRENYRALVDGVLSHLALPEGTNEEAWEEMVREIVEKEAGNIASLTPEQDLPEPVSAVPEPQAPPEDDVADDIPVETIPPEYEIAADEDILPPPENETPEALENELMADEELLPENPTENPHQDIPEESTSEYEEQINPPVDAIASDPDLAALEDELFPLEDEAATQSAESTSPADQSEEKADTTEKAQELNLDQETLTDGGFL